jgi:hypothetical protein
MPIYPEYRAVPHAFRLPALLAALASLFAGPLAAQPCQEKQWIDTPIIARALGREGSGDGIGGTGRGSDEADGIGGTGRSSDAEGIGGTGRSPLEPARDARQQLGFIGVIAGFASICVNGQEIHFSPATTIRIDGKISAATQLQLGQMVSVAARAIPSASNLPAAQQGEYHASRIDIFNTLIGPVQEIDAAKGTLRMLGQRLLAGAENTLKLAGFTAGDHLIANGSRLPNGDILLTRLERAAQRDEVSLVGPVTQLDGNTFKIFNAHIQTSAVLAATLRLGQEVFVSGKLASGTIQADTVTLDPQLHFDKAVRRLDLQGHIRRVEGSTQLNVGGAEIRLDGSAKLDGDLKTLSEGLRVKVSATLESDGRIVAERIRIERPARRPDNLASPGNPERNALPRSSEREGLDNAHPPMRPEPPLRPDRPDLPARGADLDRPRPEMIRPEIARPSRLPDRPNLR